MLNILASWHECYLEYVNLSNACFHLLVNSYKSCHYITNSNILRIMNTLDEFTNNIFLYWCIIPREIKHLHVLFFILFLNKLKNVAFNLCNYVSITIVIT